MKNLDFSNAALQQEFKEYKLIPSKTIVKVKLGITQGYHNDPNQGWTGGHATLGQSGAVFLKATYTVQEGEYKNSKIFGLIGLHSPKGPAYKEMGRSLMRAILESAHNISSKDNNAHSISKRSISSFDELNNLIFLAEVGIGKNHKDEEKNEISKIITPDHPKYLEMMNIPTPSTQVLLGDDEMPF